MAKADAGAETDKPASSGRRRMLLGLAAGGAGLGLPAATQAADTASAQPPSLAISFEGEHQAGVTTPQPYAGMVVAFDVLAENRDQLQALFVTLTERIRFLTQGGTPPKLGPGFPAADSGILGPTIVPEHMTVTLAVGASLFDERFGLTALRPRHLSEMESFFNDALEPDLCHGDLLLQFCAETPEETIHALRDIVRNTPDTLALRWKQEGFAATHGSRSGPIGTGRNMLGFKDGTANADIRNPAVMNDYVWLQPGGDEPAWTAGGTYQAVRLIRNFVERWDRTPLGEQESIIGRHRDSGAPLGKAAEFDDPDYASDAKGERVPLDAHVRLANPRAPGLIPKLIRRGFNYSNGVTRSGQLDMGLLFIAFQANLTEGFVATQKRLDQEPLEEYVKPFGGGYFFVLPGVTQPGGHLGQPLFQAVAALQSPSNEAAPANGSPNKG